MKTYVTILIIALLVSGCASTAKFQEERTATSDEGTIYIIREYAEPTAWRLNVFCDDQRMAQVANRSYTKIHLREGIRKLYVAWPSGAGGQKFEHPLEIRPNEERYFLVMGKVAMTGVQILGPIIRFSSEQSLSLAEVSPESGRGLVRKMDN